MDDPDTECEGMKYDVGCKHADNVLARGHQDSMLFKSEDTNNEPDRQPVTLRSTVWYPSKNKTPETIWLSSIQTHPTAERTEKKFENRSSICMMLGCVHNTTKI